VDHPASDARPELASPRSTTLATVSGHQRPLALRLAAGIATGQAAGLAIFAAATIVEAARGDRASLGSAGLLALLAVAWCVGLGAAVVGLLRGRRRARAPVVVSEILLLSIGIPLAQSAQTGQKWLGAFVIASAVVGLAACMARSVTGTLTET